MKAIILKGTALRQPPLPQSDPRAKTIAHPCFRAFLYYTHVEYGSARICGREFRRKFCDERVPSI
jgi:hypothetical protein